MYISKRAKLNLLNVEDYFTVDLKQMKEYSNSKILLNKDAVVALLKAQKSLPPGYTFAITSGYRSLEEQTKIVKLMEMELKISHPNNYIELLNKYTGGYEELLLKTFSHNNHRSGYAVDLYLLKNNKEIDLGGQKMDERDNLNYYKNKKSLSKKELIIKKNRDILNNALSKYFNNNPDEWWHWGYINVK